VVKRLSERVSDLDSRRLIGEGAFALSIGTGVGFYDGFFGPGTGTFFAIGLVALLGYNLRRATAHARVKEMEMKTRLSILAALVLAGCLPPGNECRIDGTGEDPAGVVR